MKNSLVAALLIGGKGERFWPRSRKGEPKQFLPITGDEPMVIETMGRVAPLVSRTMALVGRDLAPAARKLFDAHGGRNVEIVEEAAPRSTAPAAALAALRCAADEILILLPSDHFIPDAEGFREVLRGAARLASRADGIVCVGLAPTRPETGYGYIRVGDPVKDGFRIASFVEKPPLPRAERLMAEGALWNGGIFLVRAGVYLDLVKRFIPELHEVLEKIRAEKSPDAFTAAPSVSIDYGILEKCDASYVVRGDFMWDDVGDWGAMARIHRKDAAGNAARGDFIALDARNCIVDSDAGLVAAVGVEDVAIIRHRDVVLVLKRGKEQQVRDLLKKLAEQGKGIYS